MLSLSHNTHYKEYIKNEVAYPSSVVDKITPVTTKEHISYIQEKYGFLDKRLVFSENFSLWIIEDKFCNDMPNLQQVGVVITNDLEKYELLKIRTLNASHAIIAYMSFFKGYIYVHESLKDEAILKTLKKIITNEITPLLEKKYNIQTKDYFDETLKRFLNERIKDTIKRLCADGYNRQPKFTIKSIEEGLGLGLEMDGLILANALWCRYCLGVDEKNNTYNLEEEYQEKLKQTALKTKANQDEFIKLKDVYSSLEKNEIFKNKFRKWIQKIYKNGVDKTIDIFLNEA